MNAYPDTTADDLAELLRDERDETGMSRSDLATACDVDEYVILHREKGEALDKAVSVIKQLEVLGWRLVVRKLSRRVVLKKQPAR